MIRLARGSRQLGSYFLCFALIAVVAKICSWHLKQGLQLSADSASYIAWANALLEVEFDYAVFLSSNQFIAPIFFYLAPITLIASLMHVFGENWQAVFFWINLGFSAATILITVLTLRLVKVRDWVIACAVLMFLISDAYLTWPGYMLTDSFYAFLTAMLVYWLVRSAISNQVYWLPLLFVSLIIVLTRPTSPALITSLILFFMVWRFMAFEISWRQAVLLIFSLAGLTTMIFVLLITAYLRGWLDSQQLEFIAASAIEGRVVGARYETYWPNSGQAMELGRLFFLRIAYFFSPTAQTFSWFHNALNLMFFGLVLLGSALLMWRSALIDRSLRVFVFVALIFSFTTAVFHAFTIIDFDWRYRYPIIAPLIGMAAVGCEHFIRLIPTNMFTPEDERQPR